MREVFDLLSRFILADFLPSSKPKRSSWARLVANASALFFLVFGYVLGCRALYHYLEPAWGEVYSLLALCGLLLMTSLIFFAVGWLLKPKTSPVTDFMSAIEKMAQEGPSNEAIKKIISKLSPKILVAVFTGVVVASYLARGKKKNI